MKRHEIDMCSGPLPKKMLLYALPLILSGVLQLLFNAVDLAVVGNFVSDTALGAVGATNSLINLLTNLFIGLSVGTNVLIARYVGAGADRDVHETVHTSILISFISGIILAIIGVIFARPLLQLMSTPTNVLNQSALYMRIYFLGMPIMMVYNFGSAILRAIGDTKRPLYYLSVAGVANVLMNLFFVFVLHRGVDGVAYATVLSQLIAVILLLRCLTKMDGPCRLQLKQLRIYRRKLLAVTRIGLPAGLQGCVFSLSNVVIQSSINSFGELAIAGNSAASSLEGFIYVAMNAFHQTTLSFTSQNYGAGQYRRIGKILGLAILYVVVIGCTLGGLALLFGRTLVGLYTSGEEAISYGYLRVCCICAFHFTCGIMDVVVGALRGIGYSLIPMFVSLLGVCGIRMVWIFTIFKSHHTLEMLYASYPVSWIMTTLCHLFVFLLWFRKMRANGFVRGEKVS